MTHGLRVIVASLLFLIALASTIGVAAQIEIVYFLPPASSGAAVRHVAIFGPAVAGTVFGLLVVIGLAVHLVVTIRHNSTRRGWAIALTFTALAALTPFIVAAINHPVF